MKRLLSLVLCLSMCFGICAANGLAADDPMGETAVLEGCSVWARQEIRRAITLGFVPEELLGDYTSDITRAEFAKIALYFSAMQYHCSLDDYALLYRIYYQDNPALVEPFSDCEDPFVTVARSVDLVDGVGNNLFEPDRPITRQESARLLLNAYCAYTGERESEENRDDLERLAAAYADSGLFPEWARSGIGQMALWGVMNGVENNKFSPTKHYTREQCIATFVRLYDRAPKSIGHDGVSMCPYSPEELIKLLEERFLYRETDHLQNRDYYVTYGRFQGLPHGDELDMYVVYAKGGRRRLDLSGFQRLESVAFGNEPGQLVITGYTRDGETTETLDLNTGEEVKSGGAAGIPDSVTATDDSLSAVFTVREDRAGRSMSLAPEPCMLLSVETDPAVTVTASFYSGQFEDGLIPRLFRALTALPVPSAAETDDYSNTDEVREAVGERFRVIVNGENVTGDLWRTQGNGHVDFVFRAGGNFDLRPGDTVEVILYAEPQTDTLE